MERITLTTRGREGYELLDSGREEKLERFGNVVLRRPDPQALWEKALGEEEWEKANGVYVRETGEAGKWTGKLEKEWQIEFGGLNFLIKPTSFKHTGLFPEQLSNWEWVSDIIASQKNLSQKSSDLLASHGQTFAQDISASPTACVPKVLNLFGYTGGASLVAAKAGASVTHVDASKSAVTWASENAKLSGLGDAPIRWIVEDATLFVQREITRGNTYDAIIMDPPAFGHGPKDEIWKIEDSLLELIKLCGQLLSDTPLFFLINGYAAGYSPLAFAYNLEQFEKKFGGSIEYGELEIAEKGSARVLPAGIFARWKR